MYLETFTNIVRFCFLSMIVKLSHYLAPYYFFFAKYVCVFCVFFFMHGIHFAGLVYICVALRVTFSLWGLLLPYRFRQIQGMPRFVQLMGKAD